MNKRLLQFLLFFSLLICLIYFVFLGLGFFTDKNYSNSIEKDFTGSREKMWNILTDIDKIPDRREDVLEVERLGKNRYGFESWLELTPTGGELKFDAIEFQEPGRYVVQLEGSNFDMSGKWIYELNARSSTAFNLRISEESFVDNIMVRSVMAITGRDATLKQEMNSLSEAFESTNQ